MSSLTMLSTVIDHPIKPPEQIPTPKSSLSTFKEDDDFPPPFNIRKDLTISEKCSWIRSQIIGSNVEFDTPFGNRQLSYADHTATGRALYYIENFIIKDVLPFYGNTHTDDSFVGRETTQMVDQASKYIKKCLGGKERDAILFCGSGTTAAIKRLQEVMGIAVPSIIRSRVIQQLEPDERWVVFVGPYEHHSNILSWRNSLAEVVEIGVDQDGLIDIEILTRELKSEKYLNRPKLGSFSACSNVTGIVADTRALARLLHQHQAFACFDFAASGPYVEIDIRSGESDGYDAVFLSPHKFAGGPGTPGILLMSKTLYNLKSSPPSTCGGGTVNFVNNLSEKDTLYYDDIEVREDSGTPPIVQKIRAALAFWVKEYIGYRQIESLETQWIERALQRLLPNPNIEILGNTSVKRQPIISFLIYTTTLDKEKESGYIWRKKEIKKYKPLHCRFVAKLLNDLFGIQARGGCACAGPYGHFLLNLDQPCSLAYRSAIQKGYIGLKPGWTRLSFIYYISITEFEFILDAIEFLAIYGQRFLPLYQFNWKTGEWTFKNSAMQKLSGCEDSIKSDLTTSMEHKYKMYLETAHNIAQCLPNFPSERRIPEEVAPDLVSFRI